MAQPSASSLAKAISELENAVGKLSQVQKMLLGTDGSVTNLLEIVTGQPVEIETLEQRTLPADEAVAAELVVRPGDEINYRAVKLKRADTGETLIYAVSHTPLNRLEVSFKDDLTRADIPIGLILKKHEIESRRDITGTGFSQADEDMSRVFNIFPRETMLVSPLQDLQACDASYRYPGDLSIQQLSGFAPGGDQDAFPHTFDPDGSGRT